MRKKVAVQITGYLRTIHECIDSWKNILDYSLYDYDFYIHTYKNYGFSKGFNVDDIEYDDEINIDTLTSKINIKEIVVEEQISHGSQIMNSGHNVDRVKLMFRKMYLCNKMYKNYCSSNNESYEFVIRMRPDIFFNKKVNFNFEKKDTIYVNKFTWGVEEDWAFLPQLVDGTYLAAAGMLNDQLVICSNDIMDIYCELFTDYDKYSNLKPEESLFQYINDKNIKIEYFDFGFEIKRGK